MLGKWREYETLGGQLTCGVLQSAHEKRTVNSAVFVGFIYKQNEQTVETTTFYTVVEFAVREKSDKKITTFFRNGFFFNYYVTVNFFFLFFSYKVQITMNVV